MKIQAFEQKNKVWKSFTKTSSLVKKYSNIELNHDEYAWAWFTVNTRAVYFKTSNSTQNGLDAHQTDLGDDQENLALAPFLDLFNHSSMANVEAGLNLQSNASESFYEIKTNTKYRKYDQVFINYGPHCNLRLYVEYGFSEERNENDFVPVTISEVLEIFVLHLNLSPKNSYIEKALKIVQKTKLHENLRIENNGPSWNIAALFYVMNTVYERMATKTFDATKKAEWQNVFMIAEFSVFPEISLLLLLLAKSKLKQLTESVEKTKEIITNVNGRSVSTKSFRMAYYLLKEHHSILESAVRYIACNNND